MSKPTTDNFAARANAIWNYLKGKDYCSKDELVAVFKINERIVRDCINFLRNKGYMICSISSKKGYKAMSCRNFTDEDLDDVKNMLYEVEHRQIELESMKRCCEIYFKNVEKYGKRKRI